MDAPPNEWRQRRALRDAQELADDFRLPDEAWSDVDAAAYAEDELAALGEAGGGVGGGGGGAEDDKE
jgi:hypothetical protein